MINKKLLESVRKQVKREAERQVKQNFETAYDFGGDLGYTFRRNGTIVDGSTRDTVDTGAMRDSVEMEWKGNKLMINIGEDYSSFVLFGYVTKTGNVIPPRPQLLVIDTKQMKQNIQTEINR
jgi:phage gpG-like protein